MNGEERIVEAIAIFGTGVGLLLGGIGLAIKYIINKLISLEMEKQGEAIATLEKQGAGTSEATNENTKTIKALTDAYESTQQDIIELKEALKLSESVVTKLGDTLDKEKKAREDDRKNSDKVIADLKQRNTGLETRIATVEKELGNEQKARVAAEGRLEEQFDLREQAERRVSELTLRVSELTSELGGITKGMEMLTAIAGRPIEIHLLPAIPPPDRPPTPGGGGGKIVPINGDSELDSNEVEKKDAA